MGLEGAWVLSYFKGNTNSLKDNSLYLAYSTDGLTWLELNNGNPVFSAEGIGGGRIRDPFILRKQDGTFVLLATDWTLFESEHAVSNKYWGNPTPSIIIADSRDLVSFKNTRRVNLLMLSFIASENRCNNGWGNIHAWAPEAFYDAGREEYAVIWSGDGNFEGSDNINRTYVSYTKDFRTFSEPLPFFELERNGKLKNEIDATLIRTSSKNYLFCKGEDDDEKDILAAESDSLEPMSFKIMHSGKFITRGAASSRMMNTEGPFIIENKEKSLYYLYADFYLKDGTFGCWQTESLDLPPEQWKQLSSDEFILPEGVRHANTVFIDRRQLRYILDSYRTK